MEKRIEGSGLFQNPAIATTRPPFDKLRTGFDTASTTFRPTQDAGLTFAVIVLLVLLWDKTGSYFLTAP